MRIVTAILLFALTPCLGMAQPALDAAASGKPYGQLSIVDRLLHSSTDAQQNDNATQAAMPLWATSDGRILALVAFGSNSHGAPTLPQSPQIGSATDWQLVDVTTFVAGGLSLRFGDNATAYASFGRGIVLQPLNPAAASFGCGSALSLAIDSPCTSESPLANSAALRLGADVRSGNLDLDLSYGLSRLRFDQRPRAAADQRPAWDLFAGIGNEVLPTLVIPGIELANVQNSTLSAQGRWRLDETQSLDLGAALSRIQFDLPGNLLSPVLNQAALSLGVHHGDFSGVIVGRVLGPADPRGSGQHWSSVDLGISWRAPWRGVFSVGAQNIWSSGSPPLLTDPSAREPDPGQARVPYVQYHQDL